MKRLVSAMLTAAAASLALSGFAVPLAQQAGASTNVTYTATVTVPVPPASSFASGGGGDGWGIALTPTSVYNVFHYGTLQVACHLQVNAADCWSSGVAKTITDGSQTFSTAGEPGLYLDHSDGHLFVWATRSDSTGGVVCIDTTQPASNLNPFCGFTALTAVGAADTELSGPALVGSNWYSFNLFSGAGVTGTKNKLMCFNVATHAACASQPFTVNIGIGTVVGNETYSVAAFGTDLIVPVNTSVHGSGELACFNTSTHGACAGTWPVALSNDYPYNYGAPYNFETSSGATTGFCLPESPDPCYSLTGAPIATPAGMSSAIGSTDYRNGTAFLIGPRVYVPNGSTDSIDCWDYATSKSCVNFPLALSNNEATYTLTPDAQRPSCIWVNADGGSAQIQNHDAFTGGACGAGAIRVLASSVIPPNPVCVPGSWTSLQIEQPLRSKYTSGTVAFEDGDGNPIAGAPTKAVGSTGSVNLVGVNLATHIGLPQFLISLNGVSGSPGSVVVKLTWQGAYDPSCLAKGATTGAPTFANGLAMLAGDGGMFTFGPRPAVGAADFGGAPGPLTTPLHQVIPTTFSALAANANRTGYWDVLRNGTIYPVGHVTNLGDLTGVHLNAPVVGITSTPDGGGYWMVGSDGGVFNFGDAKFEGSLGNVHLNQPIVGIATYDAHGYYLVAADGGVFPMGDAPFKGSLGNIRLNKPVVGMATSPIGHGYLLVAADGGVFNFGGAPFLGSTASIRLNQPVVAIAMTTQGTGYWLVAGDGGVFNFGAPFQGSVPGLGIHNLRAPVVGAVN